MVGYEDYYMVSNQGRLLRHAREFGDGYKSVCRRYMKGCKDGPPGYHRFRCSVLGEEFRVYVHAAMLEAFVGPRPAGYDCDHINRDKGDNRLENLRWVPHAVNLHNSGQRRSKSGVRGVYWNKLPHQKHVPWYATTSFNGRVRSLGRWATLEQATIARHHWDAMADQARLTLGPWPDLDLCLAGHTAWMAAEKDRLGLWKRAHKSRPNSP